MSSPQQPDTITRLRAANPASVDVNRGRGEIAQAALQRILDDRQAAGAAPSVARPRRIRWRSPRGLVLVFAAMLLAGGAAVAATDPFGWWNANPGEARYGVNPALRVATPTIPVISCRAVSPAQFRCSAARTGPNRTKQRYSQLDVIKAPPVITRARFSAAIAKELAAGKLSAPDAARLRSELAALPDSFFPMFEIAMRYGTYGGTGSIGRRSNLVPPPGVPAFLACEGAGRVLSCHDLNGDPAVPIGAGIYAAEPTADWRPAPAGRQNLALPPGIKFTPAELRFLMDTLRTS